MRHVAALFLLAALALPAGAQTPRSIDNPVLDGVADSGVLKYNGDYYIMGVGTGGDMYTSADLVRWRGPRHAFSMNNEWTPGPAAQERRIHACDFEYTGGVFHLYWSVNYWGEPQMAVRIGHATADSVLGPYREPVTSTWFDSRIDPHLFVDDDGTPYFYSVKFADGNVIYGQKMKDPWTRVGEPRFLLSALPGTWETRAERIIEGAEVDKHRGRYYMLYAANHVASRWGQYAIGAAEADHPLGFNNASKYDHPVVGPTNEERITENANVIVPIGEATWRYRTSAPGDGWTQASYDESDWRSGRTAFGNHDVDNSTTHRTETRWESPELWLRKRFRLAEAPSEHVQLLMRLRGAADVYVNGERIYRSDGARNYATVDVDDVSAFREGENVLAVHARQNDDRQYVDVGLLDPQDAPGEKYVFSPGQPNLVCGPNGFSWWLVYFARFDGTGKNQTIDRAYFFDQKLHVDGPTSRRTPGYHPPPRSPTFGDRFERQDRLGASWRVSGGRWRTRGGEAVQRSMDTSTRATPDAPPGEHYLFQTGVRIDDGEEAGVLAFRNEAGDRLSVSLNRKEQAWTYRLRRGDNKTRRSFALPSDFDFGAYHTLRITKNSGDFSVALDDRPAPGQSVIDTELTGTGRPALHTREARAAFDGVAYTRGWDEFDTRVTGWGARRDESAWRVDSTGLRQTNAQGMRRAVKGVPMDAYEFSAQVYGDARAASSDERRGILPVYVDENNWLRIAIDPEAHQFIVTRQRDGEQDERWSVDLTKTKRLYPDATYSDSFTKRYTFRVPTLIGGLKRDDMDQSLPESWRLTYERNGTWRTLPTDTAFAPVVAEALRVETGRGDDDVEALSANVIGKASYNLRAVKLPGEVLLFVDGEQVLRVPGSWPPARVGLMTRGATARYDGLMRFEIPTSSRD
jgi:GH43 family beta-xylosidase